MTMFNQRSAADIGRVVLAAVVVAALTGTQLITDRVRAAEGSPVESSSVTNDNASVSLLANHHYNSAAERANDALMITEVESALVNDGLTQGAPIVVDCDHGKILLTGVMKSSQDATRAGKIAARSPGVIAVKNQLTWHQ